MCSMVVMVESIAKIRCFAVVFGLQINNIQMIALHEGIGTTFANSKIRFHTKTKTAGSYEQYMNGTCMLQEIRV